MAGDQIMIAVGVGCRSGCDESGILSAIERALLAAHKTHDETHALYAPDFKQAEAGLMRAAHLLSKPLVLLSMTQLRAHAAFTLSHSQQVQRRFGVPSIAETAALAGAATFAPRARPRLLGPRQHFADATCALAVLDIIEISTESVT
jgi:cobalt-precorrin 5A hydrolase